MAARDKPLSVKFVATEGLVWQGEVVSVLVRTTEGDIGIWSGHEPFMAALVPHGAEIVTDDGARHIIAVDSGFISVFDNHVSVLSAFGELAEEISLDNADPIGRHPRPGTPRQGRRFGSAHLSPTPGAGPCRREADPVEWSSHRKLIIAITCHS